jgi:aminoglycoside phosphotransferase (APT) family kinase protein
MPIQDKINKYYDIFELNVKRLDVVTESNSSEVYILTLENNKKVVLKIPFNSQKFEREKKALELLRGKVSVPEVINYYNGDTRIPGALLISYIDGISLNGNVTEELAYEMGIMLAKIHSIKLKKYGEIETEGEKDKPLVYLDNLKTMYTKNRVFCEKVMDFKKLGICDEIFLDYLNKLPTPEDPCLLHSDYRMGNILVNGSEVMGIIDFEVANGGVADEDFSILESEVFNVYAGTKESFLEGYKSIRKLPDLDNTLHFYKFLTAFTRIGWCVKRSKMNEDFYFEFNNQIDRIIEKFSIDE